MKITHRNVNKDSSSCYVVTRHGRRIESENYGNQIDAEERAYRLKEMLKEWDPANSSAVGIVHTSSPYKVF